MSQGNQKTSRAALSEYFEGAHSCKYFWWPQRFGIIEVDELSTWDHWGTMKTDIAHYPGGRNYTGFKLATASEDKNIKGSHGYQEKFFIHKCCFFRGTLSSRSLRCHRLDFFSYVSFWDMVIPDNKYLHNINLSINKLEYSSTDRPPRVLVCQIRDLSQSPSFSHLWPWKVVL